MGHILFDMCADIDIILLYQGLKQFAASNRIRERVMSLFNLNAKEITKCGQLIVFYCKRRDILLSQLISTYVVDYRNIQIIPIQVFNQRIQISSSYIMTNYNRIGRSLPEASTYLHSPR